VVRALVVPLKRRRRTDQRATTLSTAPRSPPEIAPSSRSASRLGFSTATPDYDSRLRLPSPTPDSDSRRDSDSRLGPPTETEDCDSRLPTVDRSHFRPLSVFARSNSGIWDECQPSRDEMRAAEDEVARDVAALSLPNISGPESQDSTRRNHHLLRLTPSHVPNTAGGLPVLEDGACGPVEAVPASNAVIRDLRAGLSTL
jgi:hypothetical protein